ncbi:MAG: hypothetical protein AB8B99_22395 [Phormidesmis sp.]
MTSPFLPLPRKPFIGIAILATLAFGCTNRLKDYTQITLQAALTTDETTTDTLAATKTTVEKRLTGLGIELAEVETAEPNEIVVRVPPAINPQALQTLLTNTGQLYLRNQKPDTEDKLAQGIADLQRLLVEQNTLAQTGKLTEAEALQTQIDSTRSAISTLFEPSDLTGDMLHDARARPSNTATDTWDVNIQFNEEGAALFAAQTKQMAGTGRAVGLFLDDVLLSTPIVDVSYAQTGITGGTAVISGNFTEAAAEELEIQLKSGALPVALETVAIISSEDASNASETAAPETAAPETEAEGDG